MESEMQQLLGEAHGIVNRVERENRRATKAERERAEEILRRVGDLRDNEQLRKAVEDMNGSLNRASYGTKSRGAPALDFSMKQVQDMQAAALLGTS